MGVPVRGNIETSSDIVRRHGVEEVGPHSPSINGAVEDRIREVSRASSARPAIFHMEIR